MEPFGTIDLLQLPFMQYGDSIGEAQGFYLIMGNVDDRLSLRLVQTTEFDPKCEPNPGIQIGERFIE